MSYVEPLCSVLNKDFKWCLLQFDKEVFAHFKNIILSLFKAFLSTLSEQIDKDHNIPVLFNCVKIVDESTKDLNQKQLKIIFKVFLFVFRKHKHQINLLPWHSLEKLEDFLEICLYQVKIISGENNRRITKKDLNGKQSYKTHILFVQKDGFHVKITPKGNASDFYETFQQCPCSYSFEDRGYRGLNPLRQLILAKFCVNDDHCRKSDGFDWAVYDAIHLLESTYNSYGTTLYERAARTDAFKTILYQSPGIECYVSFFEALVKENCISQHTKKAIRQIDFLNSGIKRYMTETQRVRLVNCFRKLEVQKTFCDNVLFNEKDGVERQRFIQKDIEIRFGSGVTIKVISVLLKAFAL